MESGESDSESEPEDLAITLARRVAAVLPFQGVRLAVHTGLLRLGVSKAKLDEADEGEGHARGGDASGKVGRLPGSVGGVAKMALQRRTVRQRAQSLLVVLLVAALIVSAVGGARNAIHKHIMREREKEVRLRVAMEMENLKQRERDKVVLEKMKTRMRRQRLPPSWGMEDAHFVDRENHKKFVLGKGWVKWVEPIPKTQEQINLEKLQSRFRDDGIDV